MFIGKLTYVHLLTDIFSKAVEHFFKGRRILAQRPLVVFSKAEEIFAQRLLDRHFRVVKGKKMAFFFGNIFFITAFAF